MFNEEIGVSGIADQNGRHIESGIVFRIASELHIPIRYIGIGETVKISGRSKAMILSMALFDQRDADHEEMNSNKQKI